MYMMHEQFRLLHMSDSCKEVHRLTQEPEAQKASTHAAAVLKVQRSQDVWVCFTLAWAQTVCAMKATPTVVRNQGAQRPL